MNIGDKMRLEQQNFITGTQNGIRENKNEESGINTKDEFTKTGEINPADGLIKNIDINRYSAYYSNTGKTTAKSFLEEARASQDPALQRKFLKDGFKVIIQSSATSMDEKKMAEMGLKFGEPSMIDMYAAEIRFPVMEAIASAKPGGSAEVISKTALESASVTDNPGIMRYVLKCGFESLVDYPRATVDERTFAAFGIDAGDDNLLDTEAVRARTSIMNAIASSIKPPVGKAIAATAIDAGSAVELPATERKVLGDGFNAILNSYRTTEAEKNLARLGISVGEGQMPDEDAIRARLRIMQKIINPQTMP